MNEKKTYANIDMKRTGKRMNYMEDFLVKKNTLSVRYEFEQYNAQSVRSRFITYYKKIYQVTA